MDPGNKQLYGASVAAIVLGCILAVILFVVGLASLSDETKQYLKSKSIELVSVNPGDSGFFNWKYGMPLIIIALAITCFTVASSYKQKYGQYRSTPASIEKLLTIRRQILSTAIQPLGYNFVSVCQGILNKSTPYNQIPRNALALVNWRPMTVRLIGYLDGINSTCDGVFDMDMGVALAMSQGARAFIFDIDYLEDTPCAPVIIHRDNKGIMRSLHTGSIAAGCKALASRAFTNNYDPVLVILYLRRLPPDTKQQTKFFTSIATALDPLSTFHLGSNELGNFHNCRSEAQLFRSPITNYQKKFIVLTNYNTNLLPSTPNPKDNLDFWTNARIYQDPSGKSSTLGSVTVSAGPSPPAYVHVGATSQLLNIGSTDQKPYITGSSDTFKIALGDVDTSLSLTDMTTLLNTLGIQCVPIDVVALSATSGHLKALNKHVPAKSLNDLANPSNPDDPLSFWANGGWSRKLIIGDTVSGDIPVPIQGFIIPSATSPVAPPPSTNSNGGLVSIA